MKDQIENFEIELVSKRAKFKDIDVEVSGYKEWLNNLSTEKAKLEEIERTFSSPINFAEEKQRLSEKYLGLRESINNGLYSVDRLPFRWFALHDNNIQALEQEIELLKRDTAAIENKKTGKESRLGWLLKEIEKFEEKTKALVVPCESDNIKNELGVQILDLCSLSKNYKDSKVEISQKRQEVFDIEKELENECGVEKIEENKKKLSILDNRLKSWKKYNAGKVVEERNKFVLNSAILSLEGIKKEYKRLVLDYVRQESTRQAREKYGDLLRQKREIEDKLFDASKQKDEVRNEGVVLRDRKTAMESKLAVILEKEKELQADLTRVTVLKILHKTLTGNSGLTITLLKKFIPLLNQVANEILSQMSQITVCLEATEKDTLELSFSNGSDGGEMRSVGVSSGAERTMISIAIRMALQALTSLPTSNLFILDEPATAFDEKRLADFENILNVIKVKFDYILLITHIDAIKEYVDTVVSVDKEDGTSRLVVGR
jgi:DNA repair exonuclease SbcCD ATPase subunit